MSDDPPPPFTPEQEDRIRAMIREESANVSIAKLEYLRSGKSMLPVRVSHPMDPRVR